MTRSEQVSAGILKRMDRINDKMRQREMFRVHSLLEAYIEQLALEEADIEAEERHDNRLQRSYDRIDYRSSRYTY